MKKLLYILFVFITFTACSSDDESEDTPTSKTTVIVKNMTEEFPHFVLAYKNKNADYKIIQSSRTLPYGYTLPPITLPSDTITQLFIFFHYSGSERMFKEPFIVKLYIQNKIETPAILQNYTNLTRITDVSDPKQYPQD